MVLFYNACLLYGEQMFNSVPEPQNLNCLRKTTLPRMHCTDVIPTRRSLKVLLVRIFGYFDSDYTKENICFIINVILILSKFDIHKCKFSHCKPVFVVFLRDMENYINLISVSNNKKAMKTVRICTAFKVLV